MVAPLSEHGLAFLFVFLLRIMPVHIPVVVHTRRQTSREIHMPQAAGHAQAEVMIGDGFVAEQAAEAEVTAVPGAVQVTRVGGGDEF